MAYEPLNLTDGHVLTAADIKHIEDGIIAASGGTPTPTLGVLTVTAVPREGGQTITVTPDLEDGEFRRYKITDAGDRPTVAYDQAVTLADGWKDLPGNGEVAGTEGQVITVVHAAGEAKARAVGTATLPAPLTPDAKRLTIDKTVATGAAGTDVTLGVTASDGATGLTVTWTSSDTGVAAFTKVGAAPMHKILTLLKEGKATITAHVDGYEDDSFEFTVTASGSVAPTSIQTTPAGTLTLTAGQKQTISPKVLPEGAPQDVTVTSDHPDIVSVENTEGGFSLTGVAPGGASITVASTGTPTVTVTLPVVVPQPITVSGLTPVAGVTVDTSVQGDFNGGILKLDATNGEIKQQLPTHSVVVPDGWTAVMQVNRDYATSKQVLRMLDNRGMPISSYGTNLSIGATPGDNTIIMRGLTQLHMGIIQLGGGNATVSRLSLRPHVKGELIITHDVAPSQAVQKLLPVYREHGDLPASFRITSYGDWTTQMETDAARQLTDAGWEYGVYSLVDGEPDDYDTGDWSQVAQTLWNTRILGLKPSIVCSHNHKWGDAYARAMRAAGFPVVRGSNLGAGATVNYTPSHGLLNVRSLNALWDANATGVTDTINGITEAAEHGVTYGLFSHAALPDGDTSDGTAISQSVLAKILDAVKELVDAGKLDVITPSEWVRRHAPDVYQQWVDAK